jgi:hypothetical protein
MTQVYLGDKLREKIAQHRGQRNITFTPNDLDVLLHYYSSPTLHPRAHAPAVREATESWIRLGMLRLMDDSDSYEATDRGRVHVYQLCHLSLPTICWIDAKGELIDLNW